MKLWFCLSTGPLFNRQEDAEGLFLWVLFRCATYNSAALRVFEVALSVMS